MPELISYDLDKEYHKHQRRFADNHYLSQTIEDHNKSKFNWRGLIKPYNRSQR